MKEKFLPGLILIILALPAYAEKMMVDREEYENLKKTVELLTIQQKKMMGKARRSEEKADEAAEIAAAVAETVEDSSMGLLEGISIGGYGEVHYNNLDADDSERDLDDADIHRLVIFLSKEFSDDLRFVSEFEIEHGGVEADGDPLGGEVEIEQAYIEYDMGERTQVRGGVFLVPIGILNETHEPPTFYGVERNDVENVIIPSTWWEIGIGGTRRWDNGFSADLAVHTGLEIPVAGSNGGRIRSGRQKASNANAGDMAVTGRVRYTGIQGLELGVSLQYQEDANSEGAEVEDENGNTISIDENHIDEAMLYEFHAIYSHGPFALRALYAEWDIDGEIKNAEGGPDEQFGWYVEPSFKPFESLGLYARYEEVEGARVQDQFSQWEMGFNWWLHPNVVVKMDYRDRQHDPEAKAQGRNFDGFDIGVGYMF